MMEIKDSAIMLFGKMIALDLQLVAPAISDDEDVMKEAEDDEGQETEQSSDKETGKSKDPDEKDKVLKKPDKILPCSRCNSMDTKFCYYNNYNVNQPRHFCKSCQRYWTAGGTMRNVPVGAGRRKSKSASAAAAACYHQFPKNSRTHGTVLSFGSESRTQRIVVEDSSSESTVTTMSNPVDESNHHQNFNGFSVPPWPYNVAVPFYPGPAFWTCHVPTAWSLPWPPSYPSSEKRFRDGDDLEPERPKKVLVPKTLRMDDPDEAAKSSIWATLGIKNDGFAAKGGFFKGSEKSRAARAENSVVLCANPAALSRSLNFHERI